MLEQIDSLIFNGYKVRKSGKHFTLEETGKEASCKEAKFEAKNEYLIYKFDQNIVRDNNIVKYLFPFYNLGNAQAMCDYIIFYQKDVKKLFAVICNLKSKQKGNNSDQIKAGELFSQFIYETSKRLNPNKFEDIEFKIIKVLFSSKKLYPNNKNNQSGILNLESSDSIKECFIFENKCH